MTRISTEFIPYRRRNFASVAIVLLVALLGIVEIASATASLQNARGQKPPKMQVVRNGRRQGDSDAMGMGMMMGRGTTRMSMRTRTKRVNYKPGWKPGQTDGLVQNGMIVKQMQGMRFNGNRSGSNRPTTGNGTQRPSGDTGNQSKMKVFAMKKTSKSAKSKQKSGSKKKASKSVKSSSEKMSGSKKKASKSVKSSSEKMSGSKKKSAKSPSEKMGGGKKKSPKSPSEKMGGSKFVKVMKSGKKSKAPTTKLPKKSKVPTSLPTRFTEFPTEISGTNLPTESSQDPRASRSPTREPTKGPTRRPSNRPTFNRDGDIDAPTSQDIDAANDDSSDEDEDENRSVSDEEDLENEFTIIVKPENPTREPVSPGGSVSQQPTNSATSRNRYTSAQLEV